MEQPSSHTTSPIYTGSSVIALKFQGGILLGADTNYSMGRFMKYQSVQRIANVGPHTLVAAAGEISDFQHIQDVCLGLATENDSWRDGYELGPAQVGAYISRIMYEKRSKLQPLWNQLIVAGTHLKNGQEQLFLQYCDLHGTFYEEDFVATGLGAHLAIPLMRESWRADMSQAEAEALILKCFKVLAARDCAQGLKIQLGTCSFNETARTRIEAPIEIRANWEIPFWHLKPMATQEKIRNF